MIIIGSGGHARAVISAYLSNTNNSIDIDGVIDINYNSSAEDELILGFKVLGGLSFFCDYFDPENTLFFPAIGDNQTRKNVFCDLRSKGYKSLVIKHRLSFIDSSVVVNDGTFVGPFAHIGPGAYIGQCSIVNTMSNVEHESFVDAYSFIGPNSVVCGRSHLGQQCFLGANSCVIENIKIANNVLIGAGAVVTESITYPFAKYYGVPARKV